MKLLNIMFSLNIVVLEYFMGRKLSEFFRQKTDCWLMTGLEYEGSSRRSEIFGERDVYVSSSRAVNFLNIFDSSFLKSIFLPQIE